MTDRTETCACGHVRGVHGGIESDGRCVLRSCVCYRFEAGPPPRARRAWPSRATSEGEPQS